MSEPKVMYDLRICNYGTPASAEDDNVAASQRVDLITGYAGTAETDNTITLDAIAARLEAPRNLVVTFTAGGGLTGGYLRAYGLGIKGEPVSELFTYVTSAAAITGNVPFVTVDRISIWGCTGTIAAGDVVKVGIGAKLGLPMGSDCEIDRVVREWSNNVDLVVAESSLNRTYGTYAATLNTPCELWYVVKRTLRWQLFDDKEDLKWVLF